jgi:hypothetical protein
MDRFMTPRRPPFGTSRWTGFVAGLWFSLMLLVLPACSELAAPSGVMPANAAMPPGTEPPYVSLTAKYLQSVLKDQAAYDDFQISGLRWVHAIRGWSFLTCVHFHDHGHLRSYALFIQDQAVVDARFAVETDDCELQSYTPFDLLSGTLGRPTAPRQPPLY